MGPSYKFEHKEFTEKEVHTFIEAAAEAEKLEFHPWAISPNLLPHPGILGPEYHKLFDWIAAVKVQNILGPMESLLPNSYYKFEDWYPEAILAIQEDLFHRENIREWRKFWSGFAAF
jgi:hypothetical protein